MTSWSETITWSVIGVLGILGLAVSSEALYQGYLMLRRYYETKRRQDSEVNEVLFTGGRSKKFYEFSDKNGAGDIKIIQTIVEYIDSAEKSINMAMYICTCIKIGEALVKAYKRGVDVKVVSEHCTYGSSGSQMRRLLEAGIPVRTELHSSEDSLMHHKFCLIDTNWLYSCDSENKKNVENVPKIENVKNAVKYIPDNGIVLSGSVNWTMQGFSSNWENVIITSNKSIVTPFQEEFEKIYQKFEPKLEY